MARKTLRRCAAHGCDAKVNPRLLMCRDHWQLVPTPIKREVNAAYRERGGNPDAPMTQRYVDAIVAAVRAVKTIEDAQASAGVSLDPETLFAHPDDHTNPIYTQYDPSINGEDMIGDATPIEEFGAEYEGPPADSAAADLAFDADRERRLFGR